MNNETILSSSERICPECGRKFTTTSQWAYKIHTRNGDIYLCRYNCHRAAEKRLGKKTGRMKDLSNLNKPTKEALEADLKAGMSGPAIAKKYGCANATVHTWIKGYDLQVLQAVRKPKGEPIVVNTPPAVDMVPSLTEIEQFHTDAPVQELPKVEMEKIGEEFKPVVTETEPKKLITVAENSIPESASSPDLIPAPPFEEVWRNALEDLAALKRCYLTQAESEFKDRLLEMVTYLAG